MTSLDTLESALRATLMAGQPALPAHDSQRDRTVQLVGIRHLDDLAVGGFHHLVTVDEIDVVQPAFGIVVGLLHLRFLR